MSEATTSASEPDITPPLFKYGLIAAGLVLALLSGFVMEWKRSAARDAEGDVKEVQLEISKLIAEAEDTKGASEKKKLQEKAKDLTDEELKEAQKEAQSEEVDANDGYWMYSMIRYIGFSLICLGLLVLLGIGNSYEKAGSLIALGFILTQMR